MHPEAAVIRTFVPNEAGVVSRFVCDLFKRHIPPGSDPEGIARLYPSLAPEAIAERAGEESTFVAWAGAEVVGVVQVRDNDHVSLLFVRPSPMGLGIAMALMARAEEACRVAGRPKMMVDSSPGTRRFYERLGFVPAGESRKVDGFLFVPMEKKLGG